MSLMDEYAVECVAINKIWVDDPVGGYMPKWADGIRFNAAWEYESAPEVTVAEQQGVKRTYNIYVDKTLDLDYHEAFRRLDNNQIYRVTGPGTDRVTPRTSRLNRRLITVEQWQLPTDAEQEEG